MTRRTIVGALTAGTAALGAPAGERYRLGVMAAMYSALPLEEAEDFRYEMLNRCAAAQRTVGHPAILAVIEPLLGEDCHVIANTCWRNPPRAANNRSSTTSPGG